MHQPRKSGFAVTLETALEHYLIKHSESAVVNVQSFSPVNSKADKETALGIKKQMTESQIVRFQNGDIHSKGTHQYRMLAKIISADVPQVRSGL